MAWFRCYNCVDRSTKLLGQFKEFEADRALCPHCGSSGDPVVALVPVHFLVPDPKGPILGNGLSRWKIGCIPKREHLAADLQDSFSATGDPRAVTCPSCKGLPAWREQAKLFPETAHQLIVAEAGGCC